MAIPQCGRRRFAYSDRVTHVGGKMGDLTCARYVVLKIWLIRLNPHDVVYSDS